MKTRQTKSRARGDAVKGGAVLGERKCSIGGAMLLYASACYIPVASCIHAHSLRRHLSMLCMLQLQLMLLLRLPLGWGWSMLLSFKFERLLLMLVLMVLCLKMTRAIRTRGKQQGLHVSC